MTVGDIGYVLERYGVGALAVIALYFLTKMLLRSHEKGQDRMVDAIKSAGTETSVALRTFAEEQRRTSERLVDSMTDVTNRVSRMEGQVISIARTVHSEIEEQEPTPIGVPRPTQHDDDITPVERRIPKRAATQPGREMSQPYGPSKPPVRR